MDRKFRASSGFDASGKKIINVAKADKEVLSDAVNVDFFNEHNTVQVFSPTRPYDKDFIVLYQDKFYKAKVAITAKLFNVAEWDRVRVDTSWVAVDSTATGGLTLSFGQSVLANTKINELTFNLPEARAEGESITIRDIGYRTGEKPITVISKTGDIITGGVVKTSHLITTPGIISVFTYSRGAWFLNSTSPSRKYYANTGTATQTQTGDNVYKNTSTGLIQIILPKAANNGDVITLFDVDKMNDKNHTLIKIYPGSGHTISQSNVTEYLSKTVGVSRLIFNDVSKNWKLWTGDLRGRVKTVTATTFDVTANDTIFVKCRGDGAIYTTTLNLPTNVSMGDTVKISLKCAKENQTIIIKANAADKIVRDIPTLEFPKKTDLPAAGVPWEKVQQITITKANYSPVIELFYNDIEKNWYVGNYIPSVERVDPLDLSRFGVVQLASSIEAQVDKGKNPSKEKVISVEALSNRTSTETRQGLARVATSSEVNKLSGSVYDDLTIITPKKLNERTATETRRGLAEIGTQAQVDTNTNDEVIITPKKLNERTATETRRGVLELTTTGATAGTSRTSSGSGVYDFNSNTTAITPKSLGELVATTTAMGVSFLATDVEVMAVTPPAVVAKQPLVVTVQSLDKKIAKEDRKGLTQIATTAEANTGTDDFKYITPKKLKIRTDLLVKKTGDQMTGKLSLSAPILPVLPEMSESTLPTVPTAGFWVSLIKTNINQYPSAKIYGTNIDAKTGTLTNFGASIESVTQIWAPTKGNKKFIRSGDSSGFGPFDEIYTKNNKPTAEDIGAVSDDSGRMESMIVRDRFQVGNVLFKVNHEQRSLDFEWLDDPLP